VNASRPLYWLAGASAVLACVGCPGGGTGAGAPRNQPAFQEVTVQAGLDFSHDTGAYGGKLYPERMGSGAAFFDADGDGQLDIFLVNGAPLPGHPRPAAGKPSRLYLNQGHGTFRDATAGSGLEQVGYGMGVAVGDVDNDGDEDLYVTRVGQNSLYINAGTGKFSDGTTRAGVAAGNFSSSAAFMDYDGDGLLDLYVCRYVPWTGLQDELECRDQHGQREYCTAHGYDALEHRLYRNLGNLQFRDATREAGIAGHKGRGLAVVCGDYDQDGDTDILVANDETPNFLWQNTGKGRFLEVAGVVNFAYKIGNLPSAGMGLDLADVDGNGSADVIESDFQGTRKTLYVNEGQGFFTPDGDGKGLLDMPLHRLGFGIGFLDYDRDGWQDIFITNGHVNESEDPSHPGGPLAQTSQLFRNNGDGFYTDASEQLGSYATTYRVGRGAAFGDFDNDGDTDILIANNGQAPALLKNQSVPRNHWLGIRCIGRQSNRSGLHVVATVEAGGKKYVDETRANFSYLSAGDPRVVFGLGRTRRVEKLTLRWPSGTVQEFADPGMDRYWTVVEGENRLQ